MIEAVRYIRVRFEPDERGASLVEYALLVALIAIVCLVAVTYFGSTAAHRMSANASSISGAG
jgi:Flp pilus assembly pilin Flp